MKLFYKTAAIIVVMSLLAVSVNINAKESNYIYSGKGYAVGFVNGTYIHTMNGKAVGQINGTHVYKLSGQYVGELHKNMVLDMHLGNLVNIGNPGNPINPGSPVNPGNRGPVNLGYPDVSSELFGK